MALSERISQAYAEFAINPLITLGEWKYRYFPRRECEFTTHDQVIIFEEMTRNIRNGTKMKSSDLVRQGILGGFPIVNPKELELIPDGPLVAAINHYQGGVGEGTSQTMSVSYVIEQVRQNISVGPTIHDTTAYPRFIQAAQTEQKSLHWLRAPVNHRVGQIFGNFLVNRENSKKKEHAYSIRKAINHLKKGGVVAIYPEGTMGYQYGQEDPGSKNFFELTSHFGIPIVPMAAWCEFNPDTKKYEYFVRVAEPIYPPQEDIDLMVMLAIESLLPTDYRSVWGYTLSESGLTTSS